MFLSSSESSPWNLAMLGARVPGHIQLDSVSLDNSVPSTPTHKLRPTTSPSMPEPRMCVLT